MAIPITIYTKTGGLLTAAAGMGHHQHSMSDAPAKLPLEFWNTVVEMAPYLLFGFFVAGVLSVLITPRSVEKHLGGRGFWPLFKAALFGVPLPLCSCGVIPVAMSLRKHGASKGATIAFLLSTPQTGVDSILVTWSMLGPVFAIYRPLVALVSGLFGGILVSLLQPRQPSPVQPEQCGDSCCGGKKKPVWSRIFRHAFLTLPADIGASMLVGMVIAAVISAAVPDDYFQSFLGHGFLGMLVMMAVGVPMYVCATASVPIAAVLMSKGISAGAAMVFLMTGPATNAATFTTIWSVLGKRTAIIYLATVAGCALAFGAILDLVIKGLGTQTLNHQTDMIPRWLAGICAVILLAMLVFGVIRKRTTKTNPVT